MLFAAFACIVSNLLYCASYDYGGLPVLILSRFMTGLGKLPVRVQEMLLLLS